MTTYTHKKSIRSVTDEQFAEETVIDGAQIDSALEDVVDRVNNIKKGDIATRFTQKQYVFGYQPFRYNIEDTKAYSTSSSTYRRAFTRFPWTFITNNEHTTLDPQPGIHPANIPEDYEYRSEDYKNQFRYKGTFMETLRGAAGSSASVSLNAGEWISDWWKTWWANRADCAVNTFTSSATHPTALLAATSDDASESAYSAHLMSGSAAYAGKTSTGFVSPRGLYQFAWSHSWIFERPVLLDDLMVFLRTDSTGYTAPFDVDPILANREASSIFGESDHLIVQLTVDSPLGPADRRLNNVVVMQHQVKLNDIKFCPNAIEASDLSDIVDFSPSIITAADKILQGGIVRLEDLNIPIPAGTAVRLGIIIPWFAEKTEQTVSLAGNWPSTENTGTATDATLTGHASNDALITRTLLTHDLLVGDKVTVTAVASTTDVSVLNNTYTITSIVDDYSFYIGVKVTDVDTGTGGNQLGPIAITYVHDRLSPGYSQQMGWSVDKAEPMHDWSLNGCLTVLEEITD